MGALNRLIRAIGGPPNERPWLFELDNQKGVPRSGASWMPSRWRGGLDDAGPRLPARTRVTQASFQNTGPDQ